jgi:hypothetical protein
MYLKFPFMCHQKTSSTTQETNITISSTPSEITSTISQRLTTLHLTIMNNMMVIKIIRLCAARPDELLSTTRHRWLVDSGASYHFTPEITDFETLEADSTQVSLGDRTVVNITQKGSVKLRVEGLDLTLTNVKYMPKCEFRILSPGSLIEKGA